MKKVDFHIHTLPNKFSDVNFEFSFEFLESYVNDMRLDAIAITNHNLFDIKQYKDIKSKLPCIVLPGVEVDIDNAHLLVLCPENKVDVFNEQCLKLNESINDNKKWIDFEEFEEIFSNYEEYLLIPHYKKKPKINQTTLKKFGNNIFAGEVNSPKKFQVVKNNPNDLVPVLFSDLRISKDNLNEYQNNERNKKFPIRLTYLEIEDINVGSLKLILGDRRNVFLSSSKNDDLFQILSDGTVASTKLNLIVGKRSSGKTYTLDQIIESFSSENVKYIKQFQITNESTDKKFEKVIKSKQENIVENYLSPVKNLITEMMEISHNYSDELEKYLSSLIDFAEQEYLNDEYSKQRLYTEVKFNPLKPSELKKVIDSLINLYTTKTYKEMISEYIDESSLKQLLDKAIIKYKYLYLEYKLKMEVDLISSEVKKALRNKSSRNLIDEVDFYKAYKQDEIVRRFNRTINALKKESVIKETKLNRFKSIVKKQPFENTSEVKAALKTGTGIATEFKSLYEQPFHFILSLKDKGIPESDLYKALFKIQYSVVNKNGSPISGGERAEFNLLDSIDDARNYDVLLLDEPEASFDNVFINESIIPKINEIAENSIVFVVTHNSTMGTLMNPNYIIYTDFDEDEFGNGVEKEECYKVYTGAFSSKELKSQCGKTMKNFVALISTMEAGEKAFKNRRRIYDNLEN
ncbi:hypothetical protein EWY11_09645 [Enterococcus faecalis]|nr:hypothetical protein [Enterococcus faecalis]